MNDDRSKPAESADAFPTSVNGQITDSVETGADDGGVPVAPTKLGAVPASYGEAGGMAEDGEPGED